MKNISVRFLWLAVTFCVCLIVSNIYVPRTWQVWGLPLQLSAAVILFPISYIINDCITEVYGYKKARLVIWMGFVLSAFIALTSQLVCLLPDPMFPENKPSADAFNSLFGMVPRTTIASLLAFLCGSNINAWVMSKMKQASNGKRFGVRAIVSSLAGEFADSIIFFPVVFIGIMPLSGILNIVFTQVIVKTLYEVVILPVTSIFVKKLKEKEEEEKAV